MKVALAQINPIVGNLTANQRKIQDFISRARKAKAGLVVFPELCITGYPPEDLLLKQDFVTNNLKTLKEITRSVSSIWAVVGFVDRDKDGDLFNAAAVIENRKIKNELKNFR